MKIKISVITYSKNVSRLVFSGDKQDPELLISENYFNDELRLKNRLVINK